ncbi:MAG: Arm DNA-binding domain-containing protein [Geodermatophilaceae bacterium]
MPAAEGQKRRQVTKGGFPSRKAAEAALAEFVGQAARGEVALDARRSVGDYLQEWLAGMRLPRRYRLDELPEHPRALRPAADRASPVVLRNGCDADGRCTAIC